MEAVPPSPPRGSSAAAAESVVDNLVLLVTTDEALVMDEVVVGVTNADEAWNDTNSNKRLRKRFMVTEDSRVGSTTVAGNEQIKQRKSSDRAGKRRCQTREAK